MSAQESNPYVGPVPFSSADRPRFFGRDDEVEQLIDAIYGNPVVLFCAESGAGKTSLIHARLVPDMLSEAIGFDVLPVARVGRTLSLVHAPHGANPYIFNLLTWLAAAPGAPPFTGETALGEYLAMLPRGTRELGGVRPRLLVIDQFEEVLTTFPEARDRRAEVFVQMQDALDVDSRLSIVLALREDHLAGVRDYRDLMTGRLRGYFHMRRLGREAAVLAVGEPARQAGRPFDDDAARALVDELSLEHEAGRDERVRGEYVEPVQLQVVCWQLWENLGEAPGSTITIEQVREFGNVDQVLEKFYEAAIASLAADAELAALAVPEAQVRAFFSQALITRSGIRARVDRGETHTAGLPNAIVESLENRHVIRAEQARGGVWYELVHDRLIDPVIRANERWQAAYGNPLLQQATLKWLAAPASEAGQTLLQGVGLDEVRTWVAANPNAVTPEQRDYLEACLAADRTRVAQRQKRRWQLAGVAAVVLLAVAIVTVWQVALDRQATHQQLVRALWLRALEALDRQRSIEAVHLLARIGQEEDEGLLLRLANFISRRAPGAPTEEGDAAMRRAVLFNLQRSLDARVVADLPPADPFSDQLPPLAAPDATRVALHDAPDDLRLVDADAPGDGRTLSHQGLTGRRFSPSGTKLVTWGGGAVRLWSLEDEGDPLALEVANVVDVHIAPGEHRLVTLDALGELQLWTGDGQRVGEAWHEGTRPQVVFSPTGALLVSWGEPADNGGYYTAVATASVRRADDARALPMSIEHALTITGAAFSPDESALVTWSPDGRASLWRLDGRASHFPHPDEAVDEAVFSPDGQFLVTRSRQLARVWRTDTGAPAGAPLRHGAGVAGARWNPDAARPQVVTWGDDRTVRVWNADGTSVVPLPWMHDGQIMGAAWCGQGRVLTWTFGGFARLWDTSNPATPVALPHGATIRGARCTPDAAAVATWGDDDRARLWPLGDGSAPFELGLGAIAGVALAGGRVMAWGDDGHVRWWSRARHGWPEWQETEDEPLGGVRTSADGAVLAVWTRSGAIRVHRTDAWDDVVWSRPATDDRRLSGMTLSDDATRCAAWWQDGGGPDAEGPGGAGSVLTIWPIDGQAAGRSPQRLEVAAVGARFSPDGNTTLTWDTLGEARLWTEGAAGGRVLATPRPAVSVPSAEVSGLDAEVASPWMVGGAFNHDGSRVLTWTGTGDAYLWNPADGALIAALETTAQDLPADDIPRASSLAVTGLSSAGAEFSRETGDAHVVTMGPAQDHPAHSWVRVWRADDGRPEGTPVRIGGITLGARLVDGGRRLLAWTRDGTIVVADLAAGREPRRFHDGGPIEGAIWNAERQGLITWRADGTVRLWLLTGEQAFDPLRHVAPVRGVQTTSNGEWFLTWTEDGIVHLWSATDGGRIAPPMRHGALLGATFTSQEQAILSWGGEWAGPDAPGTFKRWEIGADFDVPFEALPTIVRALTGTDADEAGRLRVLSHAEWRDARREYERIAAAHDGTCEYPSRQIFAAPDAVPPGP